MRKITAIAWKDAIIEFSSPANLMTFIVLPVIFTFFLGGGCSAGGEDAIELLVADEDGSATALALISELESSETVRIREVTQERGEQLITDERAPALLIIPAGFEDMVLDGQLTELVLQKVEGDAEADIAEQTVIAAISTVGRPLKVAQSSVLIAASNQPFSNQTAQDSYFAESLAMAQDQFATSPSRVVVIQKTEKAADEFTFDSTAHHSAGQLITWVFVPLLGVSAVFVVERIKGTLRRLVTTPTTSATFLGGTIFGKFVTAFVQMVLLVGFGVYVMKVDWGESPAALLVILVTFTLAALAFGTMLGTFSKTENQASNLSIALGMSMALLGGCWYPIEAFPDPVATAVHILPTTWAMQGLTDIIMRGQGLAGIALEAAVLAGFAIVFFVIGIFRFRYE